MNKQQKSIQNNSLVNLGTTSLIKDTDTCNDEYELAISTEPVGLKTPIPIFYKGLNKTTILSLNIKPVS